MSDNIAQQIHDKYKDRIFCIASPMPEKTDYRFNVCILEFVTQNIQLFQMRLNQAVSSRICMNRNNIVLNARAMGCTDILWIDADTKFPINGMLKLLTHNKDIVCATTCPRDNSGAPIGTALDFGVQAQLIKMKMVGFPFMLTKMTVFDKMDELWPERKGCYFAEPPRWKFPEMNVVIDPLVGEDEYFCHYAREAGFEIWCDMELSTEIGHIGSHVFYISTDNTIPAPAKIDEKL